MRHAGLPASRAAALKNVAATLGVAAVAAVAIASGARADTGANVTEVAKNFPPKMHATAAPDRPAKPQPPGRTMTVEELEATWPRLTPIQQFAAVEQLIGAGEFVRAELLLGRSNYTLPADIAVKKFYIGLIRRAQGRPDEAVALFREILDAHPELGRVRLALATTLYQTEDDDAARYHLELVLADTASNPNVANTVKSFIGAIDGRRRWDASAYVTIAPSTNFNQGSADSVVYLTDANGNPLPFTIADENKGRSGIGIAAGLQASYRQPLTDQLDLILSGGLNTKTYKDSDFNDAQINAVIGPRVRFEWGYLGLYGLADQRFYANESYAFSYGGLLQATMRLGPQDLVNGDLTCQKREFEKNWRGSDLRYQDGHVCSVNGRYEHAFDSLTVLRVLGGYGQERTGRTHLDNDNWNIGAGLSRDLPWGISLYGQVVYGQRDYVGIYPGAISARADERWDFSATIVKRDWIIWDMAPSLQYTYSINGSNVPFFDYDAHGVNLTLTKRF